LPWTWLRRFVQRSQGIVSFLPLFPASFRLIGFWHRLVILKQITG
jgi:hypothetical protein